VARLKAAGDRDAASRVKALKKPSVPAWAVNRVSFSSPKLVERLVAAGDALRVGKGGDPRAAMQARRDAIAAVRAEAEKALEAEGHSATPQTMQRVAATLEALATYGTQKGAPVPGRLTEELTPPGFEELAAMGLLAGAPASKAPAPPKPAPAPRPAPEPRAKAKDERREKERAAKEKRAREVALAEARARLSKAEKALAEARRAREKLAAELEKAAKAERAAAEAESAALEAVRTAQSS
jgi:hypothetical protein